MAFFSSILNFFGTKSKRDMKELAPFVQEVLAHSETFKKKSDNQLREKTNDFKLDINKIVTNFNKQIKLLIENVKKEKDRDVKEDIYKQIDTLKSNQNIEIQNQLAKIKTEAFALIKETARRFNNEEYISVNATDLDKLLGQEFDYIEIKDEQAIWKTSWKSREDKS